MAVTKIPNSADPFQFFTLSLSLLKWAESSRAEDKVFGKELKMGPESKDVVVGVYIVSVVVVEYQVGYNWFGTRNHPITNSQSTTITLISCQFALFHFFSLPVIHTMQKQTVDRDASSELGM